ncbi:MAG: hypothetical protein JSW42_10110 [Chloroflexota bacterium]|nr:MAG: hypothetical protein JSW42_10110 [Chloroflexota bacterium]
MTTLIVLLGIGLVIGGIGVYMKISPSKSKLQIMREETHFPVVSGFNLNRQELEFPRDFQGNLNLVIVAFQQPQQAVVNTWIPFAQELEEKIPGFIYYELPTIYEMPAFSRTFINEGMRAGIPDQTARERTITLYLDKETFKSALDISNENEIHLFLVDQDGNIFWRSSGGFTEDKAGELLGVLEERQKES